MGVLQTIGTGLSGLLGGNKVSYDRSAPQQNGQQTALVNLAKAISLKESSSDGKTPNYNAIGDNGTSAGAYQWNNDGKALAKGQVPAEFQADAKANGLDPNDFSPENQNKVALAELTKTYKQTGGDVDATVAAWNAGLGKALSGEWKKNVGVTTINGKKISYSTPDYVKEVNKYYNQLAGAAAAVQ